MNINITLIWRQRKKCFNMAAAVQEVSSRHCLRDWSGAKHDEEVRILIHILPDGNISLRNIYYLTGYAGSIDDPVYHV